MAKHPHIRIKVKVKKPKPPGKVGPKESDNEVPPTQKHPQSPPPRNDEEANPSPITPMVGDLVMVLDPHNKSGIKPEIHKRVGTLLDANTGSNSLPFHVEAFIGLRKEDFYVPEIQKVTLTTYDD